MRSYMFLILLIGTSLVTGCVPNYQTVTSDRYAGAVKSKSSEFDDKVAFEGATLRTTHSEGLLNMYHNAFLIRGWKDKATGKPLGHQLYVRIRYAAGGWAFFQSASFEGGKQADVNVISRDVSSCTGGCTYTENVGIDLSQTRLELNRTLGLRVRLNAKSGATSIIEIPANYIDGYLSKFNEA